MKNSIYAVTYLLRKTNMTRRDIGKLKPDQFIDLLTEVHYQEAEEDYQTDSRLASLLAAIANTVPRKPAKTYRASDFLGAVPQRVSKDGETLDEKSSLEALAKRFNIKLPVKEMRDL